MSLLSALFTDMENTPAPRFYQSQNVARVECLPVRASQVLTNPAERTPPPAPTPHTSAATASLEWLLVRDHYIGHLMACSSCYAPKHRYCVTGVALRQRYDSTAMELTL